MLTIELVPHTCWWTNVRSNVSKKDWEKCKAYVRARSGDKCEVCGGQGTKHPVECHEIWEYEMIAYGSGANVQRLVDLIALCPDCHRVKHIGHTTQIGGVKALDRAIQHLCRVNQWEPEEAEAYIQQAFKEFDRRSLEEWELDIDFLAVLGIDATVKDRG